MRTAGSGFSFGCGAALALVAVLAGPARAGQTFAPVDDCIVQTPWDGVSLRGEAIAAAALAVDVPAAGYVLQTQTFAATTATPSLFALARLVGAAGTALEIEVFFDPAGSDDIEAWFLATRGFLLDATASWGLVAATPFDLPAVYVELPWRGQAYARRIAAFRLGAFVFVAQCLNADDALAARAFETFVATARPLSAAPAGQGGAR